MSRNKFDVSGVLLQNFCRHQDQNNRARWRKRGGCHAVLRVHQFATPEICNAEAIWLDPALTITASRRRGVPEGKTEIAAAGFRRPFPARTQLGTETLRYGVKLSISLRPVGKIALALLPQER
jgi:hypothetical protein